MRKMTLDTLYERNSEPNWYEAEEEFTNCGSFALNVIEWFAPYLIEGVNVDSIEDNYWEYEEEERAKWIYDLIDRGYSRIEVMEALIDRDFDFILRSCPWLIPIEKSEISKNDRVIAYRLHMYWPENISNFFVDDDTDFHFRVQINGEWWEKNGSGPVHKVGELDEEPWEVNTTLVYDGPIRYAKFAN